MITQQEAREASEKKIEEIKALAQKLQMQIVAKQVITQRNMIELAVVYIDNEKYDVEPTPKMTRMPLQKGEDGRDFSVVKPLEKEISDDKNTPTQQ
jgi:hypothetical protein